MAGLSLEGWRFHEFTDHAALQPKTQARCAHRAGHFTHPGVTAGPGRGLGRCRTVGYARCGPGRRAQRASTVFEMVFSSLDEAKRENGRRVRYVLQGATAQVMSAWQAVLPNGSRRAMAAFPAGSGPSRPARAPRSFGRRGAGTSVIDRTLSSAGGLAVDRTRKATRRPRSPGEGVAWRRFETPGRME